MESEKVKEIKTVLERCKTQSQNDCRKCPYGESPKCLDLLIGNCLNCINELESENERLKELKAVTPSQLDNEVWKGFAKSYEKEVIELKAKNELLKDRIAELENQMCRNEDLHTATEKLNDTIVLNKFAERLKEQIKAIAKWYDDHADKTYNGIREKDIDETLKEFLK